MLLALKPYRKIRVFQVKIVLDTSYCRSTCNIICNAIVICTHFNKIYILTYTMAVCHFWISIFKNNAKWLIVFKNHARRSFWPFGPTGQLFLAREKKSWTTLRTYLHWYLRYCCSRTSLNFILKFLVWSHIFQSDRVNVLVINYLKVSLILSVCACDMNRWG
jgi:hypothetical protein